MPSNNTRARAGGAEPAYPAHDDQVAVKKQEGNRRHTVPPHLTAGALASLAGQEKTQLSAWYEEQHTHEQLAVGADTSRAGEKIEEFFKDVEKNVGDKSK